MPTQRLIRAIVAASAIAVAGICGILLYKMSQRSLDGAAAIGGPFSLTDQRGNSVSDRDLRGQYLLIYFGYTFCPDACPTALGAMSAAIEQLGADGEKVTPILITVDPARDTQEVLRDYAASFHPRLLALRGGEAEIASVAKSYRVYFAPAKSSDPQNYLVDHTSLIYLMGPDGSYVAHFGLQATAEEIATEIRKHF